MTETSFDLVGTTVVYLRAGPLLLKGVYPHGDVISFFSYILEDGKEFFMCYSLKRKSKNTVSCHYINIK